MMAEKVDQIVGVRMSAEQAREVKAEAANRGITVRKLFEELWKNYLRTKPAKS